MANDFSAFFKVSFVILLPWIIPALDTSENDRRMQIDMSSSVEIICEALDSLLTLRDNVRDTAETSRKLAAFYLDAEKVTKWIEELGRPFLEK